MSEPLELYIADLEEVPENVRELYIEKKDGDNNPDGYKLHINGGAVASEHLSKMREHNIALRKKIETFGDNTPDSIEELRTQIETLTENLENTKSSKDKSVEDAIKPLKEAWQNKELEKDKTISSLNQRLDSLMIDTEATKICGESGVLPEATMYAVSKIREVFVREGDKVVPKKGDGSTFLDVDTGEAYTMKGFVQKELAKSAKFLFVNDSGGGAPGKSHSKESSKPNPWKAGESFNMTQQARLIREEPKEAERLMKAAGMSTDQISEDLSGR